MADAEVRDVRRLIVNADDFGFTPSINRGIAEAFEAGVVTSVSMMASQPGWRDAVAMARAASPELDIGLHLNLSVGQPLTHARSLIDSRTGAFLPVPALVARALAGRVRPEDAYVECRAQAEQLHDAGLTVTHLDGHLHLHLLPGVWTGVVTAVRELGPLTIRVPRERRWPGMGASPARGLKRVVLGISSAVAARSARATVTPPFFFGGTLHGHDRYRARLRALVHALPPGTSELMTHPGYVDGALPDGDPYGLPREAELRALTSPGFRELLQSSGVVLTNFRMSRALVP